MSQLIWSLGGQRGRRISASLGLRRVITLAMVVTLWCAGDASAQVRTAIFDGASGGTWTTAAHWSPGSVPVGGSVVHIGSGTESPRTMNILTGMNALSGNILLGASAGASGTLNMSGGSLTISGAGNFLSIGNISGGSGYFNMTGGSLSAIQVRVGGVAGSTGVFVLDGGTVNLTTAFNYNTIVANGTFNMLSGRLTVPTFNMATGILTSATFNHDGGIISGTTINLATGGTSYGVYNLNGGTLAATGVISLATGIGSTGIFDMTGGSVTGTTFNIATATNSIGTFMQDGGTVNSTIAVNVGTGAGASGAYVLGGSGVLRLSGTAATAHLTIGSATGVGSFIIEDGSTAVLNGDFLFRSGHFTLDSAKLSIGRNLGVADLALTSSSMELLGNSNYTITGILNIGTGGTSSGAFSQTGGTMQVGSTVMGSGVASNALYDLQGGRFIAGSVLTIGSGNNSNVTFINNGGTISTTGIINLSTGNGSTGIFDMTGGSVTGTTFNIATTANAIGTFMQDGGTVNSTVAVNVGTGAGASGAYVLGGSGVLRLSGGATTAHLTIGSATGMGSFVIEDGSTAIINGDLLFRSGDFTLDNTKVSIGRHLQVADVAGTSANMTLITGGSFTVSTFNFATGNNTVATFTQESGSILNATGINMAGLSSAAVYDMTDAQLSATATIGLSTGGTNSLVFNQTGGTVSAGTHLNMATAAGASVEYNLNGGLVTTGGSINFASATASTGATGTFNIVGGTVNVGTNMYVAGGTSAFGVVNLTSGGSLHVGADLSFGGRPGGSGELNIEAGSFVTVVRDVFFDGGSFAIDNGKMSIGRNLNVATGVLSSAAVVDLLSGQNLTVAGSMSVGTGASSAGTFNQDGGTVTVATTASLSIGTGANASGVYNLTGNGLLDISGATADLIMGGATGLGELNVEAGSFVQVGRNVSIRNGDFTLDNTKMSIGTTLFIGDLANTSAVVTLVEGQNYTLPGLIQIGTVNTSNGGTFNQTGGTVVAVGGMNIGTGNNSVAIYNLGGSGVLQLTGATADLIMGGASGFGMINIEDGSTVEIARDLSFRNGHFTLDLTKIVSIGRNVSVADIGSSSATMTLVEDQNLSVAALTVSGAGSSIGTFNMTGGTVTASGAIGISAAGAASSGVFNMDGGLLSSGTTFGVAATTNTSATFNQIGGTVSVGTIFSLGTGGTSSGHYNLTGGVLSTGTNLTMATGLNSNATFTSTDNSTLNVNGTIAFIGTNTNAQASLTHDGDMTFGGTLVLAGGTNSNAQIVHTGGSLAIGRILNLATGVGGTASFSHAGGDVSIGAVSGGTVNIATNTDTVGSYIQTGGTLGMAGSLNLATGTGSTGTFSHTSGDLTVGGSVVVATAANSTGFFEHAGGTLNVASNVLVASNTDTVGHFSHGGGDANLGTSLNIAGGTNAVGSYTQTSGNLDVGSGGIQLATGIGSTASFVQTNGNVVTTGDVNIATASGASAAMTQSGGGISDFTGDLNIATANNAVGTYSLSGGTLHLKGTVNLATATGSTGVLNLAASRINLERTGTGDIDVSLGAGTGSATFNLTGGTLKRTGTGTGAVNLTLRDTAGGNATVRGYGAIDMTSGAVPGGSGTFTNNGMVIADGGGTQRTLSITGFSTVADPTVSTTMANGLRAGYYATGKGELSLGTLTGFGTNESVTWGELRSDSTLSLVNTVNFNFMNMQSGGDLNVTLQSSNLAPTNTTGDIIGMWNTNITNGAAFGSGGSVAVTFRYDDILDGSGFTGLNLNENDLKLYKLQGTNWTEVGGFSLNTTNKTVSATVTSLGRYAVGVSVGSAGLADPVVDVNNLEWSVAQIIDQDQAPFGVMQSAFPRDVRGLALDPTGRYLYVGYNTTGTGTSGHTFDANGGQVRRIDLECLANNACDEYDTVEPWDTLITAVSGRKVRGKYIATDDEGRVYLAEGGRIEVLNADLSGTLVDTGLGGFLTVNTGGSVREGLTVVRKDDDELYLYTTDRGTQNVHRYILTEGSGGTISGFAIDSTFGTSGIVSLSGMGGSQSLRGIKIDGTGRIWVADLFGDRVYYISADGGTVGYVGVADPFDLAIDGSNILVSSRSMGLPITVIDGNTLSVGGTFGIPWDVLDLDPTGENNLGWLAGFVFDPIRNGFFLANEHGETADGKSKYGPATLNSGIIDDIAYADISNPDKDPIFFFSSPPPIFDGVQPVSEPDDGFLAMSDPIEQAFRFDLYVTPREVREALGIAEPQPQPQPQPGGTGSGGSGTGAVPEPTTFGTLGLGLSLLLMRRRRRTA